MVPYPPLPFLPIACLSLVKGPIEAIFLKDIMTHFSDLALAAPLQSALATLGYTSPTPIQAQAIPSVLAGHDLLGIAQTGTGKTAAFALPILDHILRHPADPPKRGARMLVLAPTRELVAQIAVSLRDYGRSIAHLRVAAIFGGVPINRQINQVTRGNDVLVATPGRLLDLVARKALQLGDVEILVLDEADQMMDMGFIKPLRDIAALLPTERQTLFFSATMVPPIRKLAAQFLRDPVQVSVTPANKTADKVEQSVIFVSKNEKRALLALTLLNEETDRVLAFTRTKHGAERAVKYLHSVGIASQALHGNKSQSQRRRALEAFRSGDIPVLVATDIAARGIDIEGISHVINYEIPNVAEQYVHRIGRTARAGRTGQAIAFISADEKSYLKDIQKLLGVTLPVTALPEDFNAQAAALKDRPALAEPEKPASEPRKNNGKKRRPDRKRGAKKPADKPSSDKRPTDKRPTDKRPADKRPSDKRSEDERSADKKQADKRSTHKRSSEKRPKDKQSFDNRSGDKKYTDKRSADKGDGKHSPEGFKPNRKKPGAKRSDAKRPESKRPESKRSGSKRPGSKTYSANPQQGAQKRGPNPNRSGASSNKRGPKKHGSSGASGAKAQSRR